MLLLGGSVAWVLGDLLIADLCWNAGDPPRLFPVVWTAAAIRRRQPTVDVIAVLALAGALAVDEPFAGAMITVMLASGQVLEARAQARARRELSLLLERSPRTAHRRIARGVIDIPVEAVVRGERLVVGTGGSSPWMVV